MPAPKRKPKHSTRLPLDALSVQDIHFCQHYAEHGNATEAYRKAGYRNSGGTPTAVRRAACDQLTNPHVRRFIRTIRQQAADAAGVSVARLAQELARQAFGDRRAIFDNRGRIKPPHQWPEALKSMIAEVDVFPGWKGQPNRYRVRFESSFDALQLLARWHGMSGQRATTPAAVSSVRVVGGDADPGELSEAEVPRE